jgi:hypothetical protein
MRDRGAAVVKTAALSFARSFVARLSKLRASARRG